MANLEEISSMKKIFRDLKVFIRRGEKPQNFVAHLRGLGVTLDEKVCLEILREIFLINKGEAHANGYFSYFEKRFNLFDLIRYPELKRDYKRLVDSASVVLSAEMRKKDANRDKVLESNPRENLIKAINTESPYKVIGLEYLAGRYSYTGGGQ